MRTMSDVEQRRLAWRCRRGLLELDIVLQCFVSEYFSQLNFAEMQYFDAFLDLPDSEFWSLINENPLHETLEKNNDQAKQSLLIKLRNSRLLKLENAK